MMLECWFYHQQQCKSRTIKQGKERENQRFVGQNVRPKGPLGRFSWRLSTKIRPAGRSCTRVPESFERLNLNVDRMDRQCACRPSWFSKKKQSTIDLTLPLSTISTHSRRKEKVVSIVLSFMISDSPHDLLN